LKILAVDDDMMILDLLTVALEHGGHRDVTVSTSPSEALLMVRRADVPFECIMLDVQMPEMDGIELCRNIRMSAGYEETPILMLTAMTERSYIERAFLAGATDYITKPFDVFEIGARVGVAAKLSAAHAALEERAIQRSANALGELATSRSCISRTEMAALFADDLSRTKPLRAPRMHVV